MINPKQVRIGNYVFDKDWDAARPIGATDIYNMVIKGSENFEPIELNPDWLGRCGEYCKSDSGGWEYKIQVGALNWFFRWNTEWYSELGGIYLGAQIKYLHQLQNIYHDFIGSELTIKPNKGL